MQVTDTRTSPRRSLAQTCATGGTVLAALVFLFVGVGSLGVNNGVFSAGIALMLIGYAALLGLIARAAHTGWGPGNGAVVASSLLHMLVGVSTARGSNQWWLWIFVALAAATLVGALKAHLDEVKADGQSAAQS